MLVSVTLLQSQNKVQHQIDIMGGSNIGLFKDLTFSPLNYNQKGSFSGVQYSRINNKNLFVASIDYSKAELTTNASDYFTVEDNNLLSLSLEFLRNLNGPENRVNVALGSQYRISGNLVDWNNLDAYSFNFAHSIGVVSKIEYQLSGSQVLYSKISVPIITLLVRPPYAGLDKTLGENKDKPLRLISNGEITSVKKYAAFDLSAGYGLHISNSIALNLEYNLRYQHVVDVHSYTNFQNHFKAGFGIKF